MSEELKPCPCCNGEAYAFPVPWEAINNALYLAEEYAKYHLAQSFGDYTDYDAELRAVDEWVRSNAPKETAE